MPSDSESLPRALEQLAPELTEFYLAWLACRAGGMVPTLSAYLDAPPFRLQPYTSIVDLHSETDLRIRLFGTALVALAGQDFTSRSVVPIYSSDDIIIASYTAWHGIGHPAGYTCIRAVRPNSGVVLACECICLPLAPPSGVPRCMITFNSSIPTELSRLSAMQDPSSVTGFRWLNWIDIGAGVPQIG